MHTHRAGTGPHLLMELGLGSGVRVKALALKSNHESATKQTFHTPKTRQFNADLIHSIQSDQTQSSNVEEIDSSSDSEGGPLCDELQEHAKVMKHNPRSRWDLFLFMHVLLWYW